MARQKKDPKDRDPLAVELGRRGGRKGGKARAENLTAEQKTAIAKLGAAARWGDRPSRALITAGLNAMIDKATGHKRPHGELAKEFLANLEEEEGRHAEQN